MGKPTGFIEFTREVPKEDDPLLRISHNEEFHQHFSEEKLQTQGAR
jgi:glutamate synthase (NADPH/NADH) small chain